MTAAKPQPCPRCNSLIRSGSHACSVARAATSMDAQTRARGKTRATHTSRKRKAAEGTGATTKPLAKKPKKAPKATIPPPPSKGRLVCRICTDEKPFADFPAPPPRSKSANDKPVELPPQCQSHLGRSSSDGAVCKACITAYLSASLEVKGVDQLGCLQPGCSSTWDNRTISFYLRGTEALDIYLKKVLELFTFDNPGFLWCINPKCSSGGLVDKVSQGYPNVECGACGTRCCALCKVEWHKGMTCQEYRAKHGHLSEEEKSTLDQLAKEGYKRCPRCQMAIMKTYGCNHVMCTNCHHGFNYNALEKVRSTPLRESLPRKAKKPPATERFQFGMFPRNTVPGPSSCEADVMKSQGHLKTNGQ